MSKLLEYAQEKESEGQFIDALNYYEMVMEEKGCPFDIRYYIGRVLNKIGQYEKALSNFDLVLTMDETHAGCYFEKGIANVGTGNWFDAYNFFVRSHNLGLKNTNIWYFLSVLGKTVGLEKNKINQFFNYFKKMDSEDFEKERSQYHFGLYFYHILNQLNNHEPELNIKEFEDEFRRYGLDDKKIILYLRTLSYEELIDKIKDLKKQHQINTEKQIIHKELIKMGLSDEDIKDIFAIDSIENLKEQVISTNPKISFPEPDLSVDIPLYYRSPLAKFVDKHATDDYQRIKNVSQYNEYCLIMPPIDRSKFIRITGSYGSDRASYYRNKSKANNFFNESRKLLDDENIKDGFYYLRLALRLCPPDYYNILNMRFYYANFLSKLNGFDYKYEAYKLFSSLKKFVGLYKNVDVFILNMANLCYDLSFYHTDFIDPAIGLYYDYLKNHPSSEEVIYLLRSLMNYKHAINRV